MELTAPPLSLHAHAFAALKHLTHEQFVSGEAIAQRLGISRATVWQAMRQLEELGLELYKVRRQGYRLARPYDALDAQAIARALGPLASGYEVSTVNACGSTNSDILTLAALPANVSRVLATELQTAGRGRRGRAWVSGLGNALTFSVLRNFDTGLAALSGLSLAMGLAVAQALEELGAQGVKLKWPNDVLLQSGDAFSKLGGILIELSGDALGPTRAVIGIGLNIRLPDAAREQIGQPAAHAPAQSPADLAQASLQVSRNRLLAGILRHLHAVLATFEREGFGALRGAWNAHHAYQGSEVVMINEGRIEKSGVVEGVDANGALRLTTSKGLETVVSGELSLRPAARNQPATGKPA
jgi:BirA family biotin operon repressor/biotin-[acetyl-CoA-carboxylase] ligase